MQSPENARKKCISSGKRRQEAVKMSDVQSDSNIDEDPIDENDLREFKETVIEYFDIPKQIKALEEPVKTLKAKKKACEETIMAFMKQKDITQCTIPAECDGGVLVIAPSTTKTAVKKDNWTKGFEAFARKRQLDITFEELEAEVEETRERVTKHKLKRRK